jgi:two-component system sensor histidine kinase KdpD
MIKLPALSHAMLREPAVRVRAYAESLFMVAVATGVGLLISPRWGVSAADLVYLVPVMAAASLFGFGPGITSALASALAYNFFFTRPVHSFRIHSPADVVTVVMLLAVALVVSQLAAAMRAQARTALANAARNATIAGFAGELLPCVDAERIGLTGCRNLAQLFDCNAAMLIERDGQPIAIAREPGHVGLTPADFGAAAIVFRQGEVIGRGSPRLNPADWLFFPVTSNANVLAAVGLARDDGRLPVTDEQVPLLTNLLDQMALALERSKLERQMQDVASLRERDHLRGALLSSVGHDLRTPLTAILAAAGELRQADAPALLVDTIEDEGGKLGRYIANLLDMARIEAGSIRLHAETVDLVDAVGAALRDLKKSAAAHCIAVDLGDDLPLVRADPHLLHHVLLNLLDNAMRYSAAGSIVRISGQLEDDAVSLSVIDHGPGLPEIPRDLFDRFSRIAGSDRKGGTGLGLGIVKGFADAMGVRVEARNNAGGGATFELRFPSTLLVSEDRLGQGA